MKALSFATVFAALSGFVLMLIAARALGDVRSAELMAYWGLFFACTGFIDGLMQETTRAVAASTSDTENAARPASVGTLIARGIGALALVVTPFVVWAGVVAAVCGSGRAGFGDSFCAGRVRVGTGMGSACFPVHHRDWRAKLGGYSWRVGQGSACIQSAC